MLPTYVPSMLFMQMPEVSLKGTGSAQNKAIHNVPFWAQRKEPPNETPRHVQIQQTIGEVVGEDCSTDAYQD